MKTPLRIIVILFAALMLPTGSAISSELSADAADYAAPINRTDETAHEAASLHETTPARETASAPDNAASVETAPSTEAYKENPASDLSATREEPPKQAVRSAAPTQRPAKPRSYVSLDFTDVDLQVLIKFMSEQTGRNFLFDERVQGKVSIVSPNKMTEEDAYNVFLSVLQVKGFATVDVGNAIKIVPSREIRQESIPTEGKEVHSRHSGEFVTRLVPLRHTESLEVIQMLTPLLSKDGMISSFPSSNTIMLIDSRQNIDRLMEILRLIDVESVNKIKIFQLTYAPAQDLAKTLEQLFSSVIPSQAQAGRAPQRGAVGSAGIRFIAENRTNNLIVIAPPEIVPEITNLIAQLDIPIPIGSGKIHVYYLENADAEETAETLSSITGITGITGDQGPQQRPQQANVPGASVSEFENRVKIKADKATNSLVIAASPNDYKTLMGVIKKLDIRRRQIFVEAVILEVNLDKSRDLGVEWRAGGAAGNYGFLGGTNFFSALSSGDPLLFTGAGLLGGGTGRTVTLPDGTEVPSILAVIRAVETRNDIKILSSPHLLTQNNKEAEIIVGENVPFISSQSRDSTNLANVINTVERKDVGVTLKITPHIHESEFVSLDIYQESSALKETSLSEQSQVGPTTTKRSAKTTVLVKSGDSVLIGGIVQETKSDVESRVPFLGSIPLLGWLFKYNSKITTRTNLVILLTPHIIQEPGTFTDKLAEQQQRILDDFDKDNPHIRSVLPPPRETLDQ